jgi:RNA polymerase sigma-70 factor (ECF subfamily)
VSITARTLEEARALAEAHAATELRLPASFKVWISPAPGTESFEDLLLRIRPRLLRIAVLQHRIPFADVEDLIQETLLIFVGKAPEVNDPEAWIVATLAYRCTNFWRSQRKSRLKLDALTTLHSSEPTPVQDQAFASHDARVDLEHLTDLLSARQREVLRLRYVLGYGPEEIAEAMGYHVASVRKIARRALDRLALLWHQHGLSPIDHEAVPPPLAHE